MTLIKHEKFQYNKRQNSRAHFSRKLQTVHIHKCHIDLINSHIIYYMHDLRTNNTKV